VVRVAVNRPLPRTFDYLVPGGARIAAGCRVRVSFGREQIVGMVLEVATKSDLPFAKLKDVSDILDASPILNDDELWLIRLASVYYHHPIGEVVAAALPTLLRQGRSASATLHRFRLAAEVSNDDIDALSLRAPRQAEALRVIADADAQSNQLLNDKFRDWSRLKRALLDKNLIVEERVVEEKFFDDADDSPIQTSTNAEKRSQGPSLNLDQIDALRRIREGGDDSSSDNATNEFAVNLLDGVTGSGKTEVYLNLIEDQLAKQRQTLVLVPEIGLTPQLVERFRQRLGIDPVVMHSALGDSERLAAWRATVNGAPLVVGTRSAVFVPLRRAGLIIVDEEHDASLKQQEGLRYSARDLAVAKAKRLGVPIVLGSATPSLETIKRCRDGAYRHIRLPQRAGGAVPPLLRLVDLTRHPATDGLSQPAIDAIRRCVSVGSQALVFLNRRGFAPTLICSGCGTLAECSRCDSRLTVHAGARKLKCHHCGAERELSAMCTDCGSELRALGEGTERLEDALRAQFPGESIARIDSDSMRLKGMMDAALQKATTGETRILIGTQMLSKGHHFPNLTLVIAANADQGLFSTDYRSSERLAQSLVQVSGRAGREQQQGEVFIQTAFANNPFWSELMNGGYEQVVDSAMAERQNTAWPPYSRLGLIRASAARADDAHRVLAQARVFAEKRGLPEVRVLGPVSAPMERRAGRYRAQLLLQSRDRGALHQTLDAVQNGLANHRVARRARWSIDVDPIELY